MTYLKPPLALRLALPLSAALTLVLGGLVLGCKDEHQAPPEPTPTSHARGGRRHDPASPSVQPGAEPVKRKAADWPRHGRYERFLKMDDRKRRYLVQIPGNYDGWNSIPLMFVLHDQGGTPEQYAQSSMDITKGLAAAGYIAVFPEGAVPVAGKLGSGWADGLCSLPPDDSAEAPVDDVAFIRAILKDLTRELKVDDKRVYVLGVGEGGTMAHRVGAEMAPQIAAVVAVAATIGCRPGPEGPAKTPPYPKGAASVLMVHGEDDKVVPIAGAEASDGGPTLLSLPLRDAVTFWTRANKCDGEPVKDSHRGEFDSEIYTCKETHTEVALLVLHDGIHAMPTRIGSAPAMKTITSFLDHPSK